MPNYWLFKSEPDTWSWDQQKAKGKAGEEWTGVRNYQARNFMRSMKLGDMGFFYHSNEGREVVGIVEVCKLAHRDSTSDVDEIKADPKLKGMVLVTNSRLSVQPVSEAEFRHICKLGGAKI